MFVYESILANALETDGSGGHVIIRVLASETESSRESIQHGNVIGNDRRHRNSYLRDNTRPDEWCVRLVSATDLSATASSSVM